MTGVTTCACLILYILLFSTFSMLIFHCFREQNGIYDVKFFHGQLEQMNVCIRREHCIPPKCLWSGLALANYTCFIDLSNQLNPSICLIMHINFSIASILIFLNCTCIHRLKTIAGTCHFHLGFVLLKCCQSGCTHISVCCVQNRLGKNALF